MMTSWLGFFGKHIIVGLAYDCYLYLPIGLITCFNNIKDSLLLSYSQLIAYHTLLTNFTQIQLKKNEKIQDFHCRFFRILYQMPNKECLNQPVIFGCLKNAMSMNGKYAIRVSNIATLEEAMAKSFQMEENILESNVDPVVFLGKAQR